MTTKTIKAYKAFSEGLKCRDFQYEVGKEYEHNGRIKVCNQGFHACENPLDTLEYYSLVDDKGNITEFAEVEQSGKIQTEGNKICSSRIKIQEKLNLAGFIQACLEYIFIKTPPIDNTHLAASGHSSRFATSGTESRLATSGHRSQLAASGDESHLAASGDESRLAASGDYSQLATSGHSSRLATSGHSSRLATSGNASKLAASGDYSQLAASGTESHLAASGHSSRLAASGNASKLAASGYNAHLAASGDESKLAASGYNAHLAASGDESHLAASGDESKLAAKGENCVLVSAGENCQVKGSNGTLICLCHYIDGKANKLVTGKIGENGLKADVWYELDADGSFIEVE